jgi:hypothetical protein
LSLLLARKGFNGVNLIKKVEKYTRITTFEKVINISERFCAAKIVLACQNGL